MKYKNKNIKFNTGFITQKIGKKVTIFSGERSILFTLNETAVYIFNGLKLKWDKEKITNTIMKNFEVSQKEAEEGIDDFIETLLEKKIISLN